MKEKSQKPTNRSESLLRKFLITGRYIIGCALITLISVNIAQGQDIPKNSASANLDQGANGPAYAHVDPFEWQNGNLNPNQAHQVEGHSIPYRIIMEGIPYSELGVPVELIIEYDIKHSGYHALDFLTTYRYLPYHDLMWPDHPAEQVQPWDGVFGSEPAEHYSYPVPAPIVNIDVGGFPQPLTAFNACTCPKEIHGWYADIINVEYVDMGFTASDLENESKLAQQVKITFIPTSDIAIISFGGHIASRLDWGYDSFGIPLSAGGISGSPYHMRLIDWNLNNLGNQDRSLSGAAVIEPCEVVVEAEGDEICLGDDGSIVATASGGTPPYNFVLLESGVPVDNCSSSNEPGVCTFVVSPAAMTTYTVEVADSRECDATDEATIIVNPLPVVVLDDAAFCIDAGPQQLVGTPVGGVYSGTGVSPSGMFDPAGAGVGDHTITYCYEDENGCADCDEAVITVYPLPVVNLDDMAMCIDADPVLISGTPEGGTCSGPGVVDCMFDPAAAGVGEHTIVFCFEDDNGCADCDEAVITVYPLPVVNLDDDAMCVDADPVQLEGTPAGGTYSGTGVSPEGLFDPLIAGVGEHTITYCYEDDNGCADCDEAVITVYPLPVVNLDDGAICVDADPVQLEGTPSGGSYSGPGVSPEGLFDPLTAGVGDHTITYCYEDDNGCRDCDEAVITVYPLPVVNLDDDAMCVDADPVQLEGTPAGGSYSGTGVSTDGVFDPLLAGVGDHTITYCYEDGNGCSDCDEAVITVYPLPVVNLDDDAICVDADPVQLEGTPVGGSYSGTGVSQGGLFDPFAAGVGDHTITYCYEDDNGCRDCDEAVITVYPLPVVNLDDDAMCVDADQVQLEGTPAGGSYSGTGVSADGMFDPLLAGVGDHTITYCYEDGNGCSDCDEAVITVYPLPVVNLDDDAMCIDADPVQLEGTPVGGSYSGSGVSVDGLFDPAIAGVGEHTITYCYMDDNSCSNCDEAVIIVNPLPLVTLDDIDLCLEGGTQQLEGTPLGGEFSGTGVSPDGLFDPLVAGVGDHTIIYTYVDDNNCENSDDAVITVVSIACEVEILTIPIICEGRQAQPGSATVHVTGGIPPFTYLWSTGDVDQTIYDLDGGIISVVVTDALGCTTECEGMVPPFIPPECFITVETVPVLCPCGPPPQYGVATMNVDGGSGDITYLWSNGETTQTATNLTSGAISCTAIDGNGCEVYCEEFLQDTPCPECGGFCFYTQGFYGNEGGLGWTVNCDQLTAMQMMQYVLPDGDDEVFGVLLNSLYFTLYGTDISNYSIFNMLPGGKSAKPLTGIATYSMYGSWGYVPIESNSKKKKYGSINNVLLSQAITFYFNIGQNPGSELFEILGNRLVTAPSDCLFESYAELEKDTFNIPQNVIDYLGANNTLGDLLNLAKDILGDDYDPGMVSPSDVTAALAAFNEGFDECRMFVEFYNEPGSKTGHIDLEQTFDLYDTGSMINIYPNPFSRNIKFEFYSGDSKHLTLELYDLKGSKIRTLFDKPVNENQLYYLNYDGSALLNGTYFYRLISDHSVVTGKLIKFIGY